MQKGSEVTVDGDMIDTDESASESWLARDTTVIERGEEAPGSGPLAALPTVPPDDADRMGGVPAAGPAVTVHIAHEAELRHGYTLAHLNELAVRAVRVQRFNRQVDFTVRVEIAWSAIAESLYAADEPPAPDDLIRAAWAAIGDDTDRTYRAHGWNTHDRYAGITSRFQQYWAGVGITRSPEEPIVERITLSQIWPRLSPSHRQLLLAMAVYEDYGRAAEALQKSRKSFTTQLSQARRAFLALWHDGEQPSRPWGYDRRASADSTDRHSRTYVIRVRQRRRQAHVAAHGEPPPPRVPKGKPADLGITVEELARRYKQVKSIRVLAASLGVSYGALQRRMQAEGITRPAELTEEVRQRKRRHARRTATSPTNSEQDPA
jgi:helix-turn-helix protein